MVVESGLVLVLALGLFLATVLVERRQETGREHRPKG